MAPSAAYGSAALKLPGASRLPPVDEHIVKPETRQEIVRGERVLAQPALEPHGDQHFSLDYVLGAHVRPGFVGSTDLLTRTGHESDFASDTCIRRAGKVPGTDHRYLEELAFEVVHEQSLRAVSERAEDLSRRGVRRVFALFVKTGHVKEWSAADGAFRALGPDDTIVDACLVRPLPVKALLGGSAADDEVVRALDSKGNQAIDAIKADTEARGEARGVARGVATSVLAVLEARGLKVSKRLRATIESATDIEVLRGWLRRAATAEKAADVIR